MVVVSPGLVRSAVPQGTSTLGMPFFSELCCGLDLFARHIDQASDGSREPAAYTLRSGRRNFNIRLLDGWLFNLFDLLGFDFRRGFRRCGRFERSGLCRFCGRCCRFSNRGRGYRRCYSVGDWDVNRWRRIRRHGLGFDLGDFGGFGCLGALDLCGFLSGGNLLRLCLLELCLARCCGLLASGC